MRRPALDRLINHLTAQWPDLEWQVTRGEDGRLVVQVPIRDDGADDPLHAPRRGAAEPAPEPAGEPQAAAAPEEEEPTVLPREVPRVGADLPQEIQRLAARLPNTPGRLPPLGRLLRAATAGAGDRRVCNGDQAYPDPLESIGLSTRCYVALRGEANTGPWLCRRRADYLACVGEPFAEQSVSRAFASESEAIAYCWGSGLAAELPPLWVWV